jgi:hypothetical protein
MPVWALVAAGGFACVSFLALIGVVTMLVLWWNGRARDGAERAPRRRASERRERLQTTAPPARAPAPRLRTELVPERPPEPEPEPPPDLTDPRVLSTAIRTSLLQTVAGQAAPESYALVLSPPPHPRQMTWHVHLQVEVALDLMDGRTIPTQPPPSSHDWTLASGRTAGWATGDPVRAPGNETRVVRITGLYFSLATAAANPVSFEIRVGADPSESHQQITTVEDPRRASTYIEEAVARAITTAAGTEPIAMGYSPASWTSHERVWLEPRP